MRQSALALVLTLLVFVQVACTPSARVRSYEDPVDGTTYGFVMYIDVSHYTAVAARLAQDKYTLEVMVVMRGDVDVTIPVGAPVLFMVGEERVTLRTSVNAVPVANANSATIFTQWKFKMTPSREDMMRLAEAPIRAVRVNVASEELTLVPSESQGRQLADNFNELSAR